MLQLFNRLQPFWKFYHFGPSIYDLNPDYPPLVNNSMFDVQSRVPRRFSRRTGVLAEKIGMTAEWDKWGVRHALTVLRVDKCHVIQIKTEEKDGYYALKLGTGEKSLKTTKKPQIGEFIKANVEPKARMVECKVSKDCVLPIGYELSAKHFMIGQRVDIQGITIGKGWQGCIKKWNFQRQPTTHGNSLSHRAPGSIGQMQDPGRVWPGKKMAGRMGGGNCTVQSQYIYKIDAKRNLIYIKGHVPGYSGNFVKITDAIKDNTRQYRKLPHPTFIDKEGVEYPEISIVEAEKDDPFEKVWLHDNTMPEYAGEP